MIPIGRRDHGRGCDACYFRIQYIPKLGLALWKYKIDPRESRRLLRLAVSVDGRHALCLLSDPKIGSGANRWIPRGIGQGVFFGPLEIKIISL